MPSWDAILLALQKSAKNISSMNYAAALFAIATAATFIISNNADSSRLFIVVIAGIGLMFVLLLFHRATESSSPAISIAAVAVVLAIAATFIIWIMTLTSHALFERPKKLPFLHAISQQEFENYQDLTSRLADLAELQQPEPPFSLLSLARRYEGKTAHHIGSDLSGNRYYGMFRLKASVDIKDFLSFLKRQNAPMFKKFSKSGGSKAAETGAASFVSAWSHAAEFSSFAKSQECYELFTTYKRFLAKFERLREERRIVIDPVDLSLALRAVLFSVANQYGETTELLSEALKGYKNKQVSQSDMIAAIYNERNKIDAYFPEITDLQFRRLLRSRNRRESEDALRVLKLEEQMGDAVETDAAIGC